MLAATVQRHCYHELGATEAAWILAPRLATVT